MINWVVERAMLAGMLDQVVVATTDDGSDDPLVAYCHEQGYPVFRGSQFDVLDRYYRAARHFSADIIVRITGDCPLIDPGLINEAVESLHINNVDFVANRLPPPFGRTYPIGLDTEVVRYSALEHAWQEAEKPYEREHVMPYLYDQPGRFPVLLLNHEPDYGSLRWAVDTREDVEMVQAILSRTGGKRDFSWVDVLEILEKEPWLGDINRQVKHKTMLDVDVRSQEIPDGGTGECP
jgi:spore coat polysaccharide biosynthesis protein SpsF